MFKEISRNAQIVTAVGETETTLEAWALEDDWGLGKGPRNRELKPTLAILTMPSAQLIWKALKNRIILK